MFKSPKFAVLLLKAGRGSRGSKGTWMRFEGVQFLTGGGRGREEEMWTGIMDSQMGLMWGGRGRRGFKGEWAGIMGVLCDDWLFCGGGEVGCELEDELLNAECQTGEEWIMYWIFEDNIWLPRLLGWSPSLLKSDALSQKRLKLSIKQKLWAGHVNWSQVWRLSNLLKRSAPRPSVGIGPEIKTVFPVSFKTLKSKLKSPLSPQTACERCR